MFATPSASIDGPTAVTDRGMARRTAHMAMLDQLIDKAPNVKGPKVTLDPHQLVGLAASGTTATDRPAIRNDRPHRIDPYRNTSSSVSASHQGKGPRGKVQDHGG